MVAVLPADDPRDQDFELVNRLRQLFILARNGKRARYDTWLRNYRLVHNRLGGGQSSSWMPAPRDSEIYPTLSSLVGWMTDQHTIIDVTAAADPHSPYSNFMQQIAQDLGTIIQTNWIEDDYATQIKMVIWDAFLYGLGALKAGWDQSLAGGLGNVCAKRVDPWALYLDPNASSFDDMEFCVEARRMSIDEIERRFPGSGALLESVTASIGDGLDERPTQYDSDISRVPKANPGSLANPSGVYGESPNTSGLGNNRYGRPSRGPRNILTPGIVVYEFWVKENDEWYEDEPQKNGEGQPINPTMSVDKNAEKRVAERWRCVVLAANQVIFDEYADDLWSYGKHPYERYVAEEMGEMYGIAIVDHLAQPQIYINRLLTALQHNAELVGNPIFLDPANSGLGRTAIMNKPGQRLTVNAQAMQNGAKPDWLQPPQMPPSVSELVQFWISRIDNISGLSAAVKGGDGTQTTPEAVVSTIQEAAFVRVRSSLANLETTLQRLAFKLADLIIDNYNEPRIVAIIGPTGQKTSLALKQRHFIVPTKNGALPLQYSLLVQAGASMPTSRQARVAEADKAYALGLIDRQAWFEAHQYPNWQIVLDRVNQAIADGSFNPPGSRQRRQK